MKTIALKQAALLILASTLTACNLPPAPDFMEPTTEPSAMASPMMEPPTPMASIEPPMTAPLADVMQTFQVTLEAPENAASPISPGVYVVHSGGMPLFTHNMKDRGLGLEHIAEDANPMMLAEATPGAMIFNTPVGDSEPGPATPGKKFTFTITAKPGDHLSFATMFGQSNDAFYAPADTGIPLFIGNKPVSGDMTAKVMLWDAGTEVNQMPGEGADQAPRQAAPNTGQSESAPIQLISERDTFSYGQSIQLTITPVQAFEVTLEAPEDAASPLSPGIFIVHADGMPLFTQMTKDRGLGLEHIAEDGDPMMAAEMIPGAMVFNTPVGDSEPGPATPGKKFTFTITAKPGDHLSFATMFGQSNDSFYAPMDTGIPLFVGNEPVSGDMTAKVMLWDAGTEVNQMPGEGADQAPRQAEANTGAQESETIQLTSVRDGFNYGASVKLYIQAK